MLSYYAKYSTFTVLLSTGERFFIDITHYVFPVGQEKAQNQGKSTGGIKETDVSERVNIHGVPPGSE